MTFDNLPFTDGNRYSGSGVRAGLYPYSDGETLTYETLEYSEDEGCATVVFKGTQIGDFVITAKEDRMEFCADGDFYLKNVSKNGADEPQKTLDGNRIKLIYRGFEYSVPVISGIAKDINTFESENKKIVLGMVN